MIPWHALSAGREDGGNLNALVREAPMRIARTQVFYLDDGAFLSFANFGGEARFYSWRVFEDGWHHLGGGEGAFYQNRWCIWWTVKARMEGL